MGKFKVGDKVRILNGSKIKDYTGGWTAFGMNKHVGEVHTIRSINKSTYNGRVAYVLDGSPCDWDERGLELAKSKMSSVYGEMKIQSKIVITTDGKTTIAKLYEGKKVVKTAEAKCSPEDEFNFNIGAAIALERLVGHVYGRVENAIGDFDWEKFKAGDLQVKINNEKCLEFLKQCEEHDLNWVDDAATKFNPWDFYRNLDEFSKLFVNMFSLAIPKKFVWLSIVNGKLFWNTNADKEIDEYEFV